MRARGVAEPEEADERGVELANRDRAAGNDDRIAVGDGLLGRERERLERAGERPLRQRLLRLERGDGVGEQAGLDDGLDLRLRPGALGRLGVRDEAAADEDEKDETAHPSPIGSRAFVLEADKRCQRRL